MGSNAFARKSGCVQYDLLGIPPNGKPSHPMNGLYTFKTGFGGEVTRLCGCWDYPYQMEKYNALVNSEEFSGKQKTDRSLIPKKIPTFLKNVKLWGINKIIKKDASCHAIFFILFYNFR